MRIYFLLFFSILNKTSLAQELASIQTDRPDQTECPYTVPHKYLQFEIKFSYEKNETHSYSSLLPTTLIKYGLTDKMEIRLITEIERQKNLSASATGLNPVTVGFKTNISAEKGILPTLSFIGHLTLPRLASEKNKSVYYAPAFRFTMQHTITEKIVLGYNLGAEWDGISAEPIFIYTMTTGFSFSDKIGGFLEVYGFLPQDSKPDHKVDAGFTFLVNKNLQVDISGGASLSLELSPWFLSSGISFRIK